MNYRTKDLFKLIVFVILLLNAHNVLAQFEPTRVDKSEEKILYQGRVYYLHTVQKGHTLYSITRAYGVSVENISSSNPGINLGILSEGQVLRIPDMGNSENKLNSSSAQSTEDFIYHTVGPKQTPYYLHQKYNVPVELIYKYNPGSEEGLQIGQVIKIPKLHSKPNETAIPELLQQEGIRYEVKPGDTLYSLAKIHNISVPDLVNANPELRWGLKTGQIIYIPGKGSVLSMGYFDADSINLSYKIPELSLAECDSLVELKTSSPVKVALMLPFFATKKIEQVSFMLSDSLDDTDIRTKSNIFRGIGAIEFYEGLILSLDYLKVNGVNVNLSVYDTESDTNKVKNILSKLENDRPDLILGPFSTENVRLVSQFSTRTGIPFVPPIMKDDSISKYNNSYLFQPTPSMDAEINSSVNYLSQYHNQNILLIYKKSLLHQREIDQFKNVLLQKLSTQSGSDSILFHELYLDDSLKIHLARTIRNDLKNIIILLSSQEPEVSNFFTKLQTLMKLYDIEVFGMPSWQKFKNVRIEMFHELQVTLYSPFYIDYNDEFVKSFILKCRNVLGYEPYKTTSKGSGLNYTFLGYDLGYYFINAVYTYRENFCDCNEYYHPRLMLSDYNYIRNAITGCFENRSVNLIRYTKDVEVVKVGLP